MKRLFKTFSIFCLACVLLSACSQQPPTQLLCRSPFRMGLWKRRRYTSISPVTGRL